MFRERKVSAANDAVMMGFAIMLFSFMIVGGAFAANFNRIQEVMNTAQDMVVRDIGQDGMFSATDQADLVSYLTNNGLTLDHVYFNAANSQVGYGSDQSAEEMGYDWVLTKTPWGSQIAVYIPATAPAIRSSYVPGAGSTDTNAPAGNPFTGTNGVN
ncbi:MAG: hypothetical protein M0Z41_08585 [Peptococcaceae bacterium]|jgi:hypothetical protein|nr:hypothetical protein [Peptococcaceae bacterium]